MNTENNKNNNIFNDDISIGTVVRVRKSKKNGKLMAYSEWGKVILISNQKGLHVGFAEVTSFSDRGNYYIATVKNVAYDFYQDYDENGTTAVPYDEFKEILKTQGFKPEYSEPIDENNVFAVWANLNSGVLITIETWNQDGERGYNSVKCYVPVSGCGFGMRNSYGFSSGTSYLSCFNIVHSTRDFPLRDCLAFNNGSMNWAGSHPSLWHYGERDDINYAKALAKIRKFKDADIGERFNMQLDESFAAYAKNGYTAD